MTEHIAVAPREAYAMWAATYDEENVLSTLDEQAALMLTPPLGGRALLDAGCGTARRLRFEGTAAPRLAAGIDLTFDMILRSREDRSRSRSLAAADIRSIPAASGTFDVVWCRLAAGHVPELGAVYGELSRVVRAGGHVIVTDFHPAAVRHGHVRSFHDSAGRSHVVEHFVHEADDHHRAASAAGLTFDARLDLCAGSRVRAFYEQAGALGRYERDLGLPLLLAFRYRR